MTVAARISQADMDRAMKSVKNADIERARIIMDLAKGRIEVIIGDSDGIPPSAANPWDDE